MRLEPGSEVPFIGIVNSRRVIRPRSGGQPFVKATVKVDSGSVVPIVWWDAGRAPRTGARVQVRGRVREYDGASEVHALESVVERTGPPSDPTPQVIAFYMGCVEAEAAGSTRVRPGGTGHLELTVGTSPVCFDYELPADAGVDRWCRQREMALGEAIIAGDLNASFQGPSAEAHESNVARLADMGYRSAYHLATGLAHGEERDMTLRWIGEGKVPYFYHCDYIFVSGQLADQVESAQAGSMAEWVESGSPGRSDHCPVTADLAIT
jgi:hypothetical protein